MRQYELTLICKSKEDAAQIGEKLKDWLKEAKIKIEKQEDWGRKQLAYVIKKNTEGQYLWYQLQGEQNKIVAIEKKLKLEEKIIRHLLTRIDQ